MVLFEKGKSGNPATMFKPGQSGNPKGRPPMRMQKAVNEALTLTQRVSFQPDDLPEGLAEGRKPDKDGRIRVTMTLAEALALRLIKHAMKGKGTAMRLVMEYNSGKAPQTIIHEGEITVPISDARSALAEALAKARASRTVAKRNR